MDYRKYKKLIRGMEKGKTGFHDQRELIRAAERGEIDPGFIARLRGGPQIEPAKEFVIYRDGFDFHMERRFSRFYTEPALDGAREGFGSADDIADTFERQAMGAGYVPVLVSESMHVPSQRTTLYPLHPEDEKVIRERFGERLKVKR